MIQVDETLLSAVALGRPIDLKDRIALPRIQSHWQTTKEWRLPYSTEDLIALVGKGLNIPQRWTAAEFIRQGRLLINTLARIAQLTQRKAVPFVARTAMGIFERQLNETIRRATSRRPGFRKPHEGPQEITVELLFPQHEAIWMQAIDEVFSEAGFEVALELVPPIQSVMAQGYNKTGILLAQENDPERHPILAREARDIASKITRINDTTREQFRRVITNSIEQGQTVTELARRMREEVLPMSHNRSMTIARTELNNSWTRGSATAFQESETLETVSVIGCGGPETSDKWIFRGQYTCNITDVPVTDIDALMEVGWHPNHRGVLVPSGMRAQ